MRILLGLVGIKLLRKLKRPKYKISSEIAYAYYTTPPGGDLVPNVIEGGIQEKINLGLEESKRSILEDPWAYIELFPGDEITHLLTALLSRDGFVGKRAQNTIHHCDLIGLRGFGNPAGGLGILVCEHDGEGPIGPVEIECFLEMLEDIADDPLGLIFTEFNVGLSQTEIISFTARIFSRDSLCKKSREMLSGYDGPFDIDVIDGPRLCGWVSEQVQKPLLAYSK